MDESLLEAGLRGGVGDCGQSNETFTEEVDFQWLEGGNQHVDSQVVLVAS